MPAGRKAGSVQAGSIDLARLREVLHPEPSPAAYILEDGVGDEPLTPASVLFPIVLRPGQPTVLLTQRTAHLKDHPGQISFPGGRAEPEDSSPAHTALREAEEEVGLLPVHIEIAGYLPEYRTGTGFSVTPVVAMIMPPFDLRPDPFEVAEAFEVPLAFLMNPANHRWHRVEHEGFQREWLSMPYQDGADQRFIWGATAGMLRNFYCFLQA